MNPKKLMKVEEVIEFFSATDEFKVEDLGIKGKAGHCVRISYIDYEKTTSSLIWAEHINIQQLIRTIHQLVWNHCNNILD